MLTEHSQDSETLFCDKCKVGWEILPDDLYCGWCGRKILEYEAKMEEKPLYFASLDSEERELRIKNTGLKELNFESMKVNGNWIIVPDEFTGIKILPGQSRTVQIRFKLHELHKHEDGIQGEILLKAQEDNEVKTVPIKVLPTPVFDFDSNRQIVEYQKSELKKELELSLNVHKGEMIIESIKPKKNLVIGRPTFSKINKLLRKGDNVSIKVTIDTRVLNSHEENTLALQFSLKGIEKPIEKNLKIVPKIQLEPYPYYLAIDFGTTNSCCARINSDFSISLIPLDIYEEDNRRLSFDVIPSLVVYEGLKNGKPEYEIGFQAELQRTQRYANNLVSSVKRWLGQEKEYMFVLDGQPKIYYPKEITQHFLQEVIERVEREIGQRVKKCVISHPTMFSARQIGDLRRALKDIGMEEVLMIDEASAAALDYINRRRKNKQGAPERYTLLVYDFGGGTIDIALSQIDTKAGKIQIKTLDVTGEREFGGDDVTQSIVDLIIEEFQERIKSVVGNDVTFEIPYVRREQTYQSSGDEQRDNLITMNTINLYTGADAIKTGFTQQERTVSREEFVLNVSIDGEMKLLDEILSNSGITITLAQVESKIGGVLQRTIDKIKSMAEGAHISEPDVVLLAGQSSALPLVKEVMEKNFQTVVYAGEDGNDPYVKELKGCVSKGACLYGMIKAVPSEKAPPIEITEFANRTHSAFGIATLDEFFEPAFLEVIGKGKKIPDESKGEITYPLDRQSIISILENFGTNTSLRGNEDIEEVATYALEFSEEVSDVDLKNAKIRMEMLKDESIIVTARVKNKDYTFQCKRDLFFKERSV